MAFTDLNDEVYSAIKTFLTANWTQCPIIWPNEKDANLKLEPRVVVSINSTVLGQADIGAANQADNRWDEEGTLWMDVLVKAGSGSKNARGAARTIALLFRGKTLLNGRLEFGEAVIDPGDSQDNGNWFRTPVAIGWRLTAA